MTKFENFGRWTGKEALKIKNASEGKKNAFVDVIDFLVLVGEIWVVFSISSNSY